MKLRKIILSLIVIFPFLNSCEKYEDYVTDYEYSAVYIAAQKPIRTIVARDEMSFKFGVVMGGKRVNKTEESATFEIAPDLLNSIPDADQFTLLPENYYTLSNANTFIIPKGEFTGTVKLVLNKPLFTSDPEAYKNTYALPIRLTGASTDSILSGRDSTGGKDYSIIVVKYISPYHGFYYQKGKQQELDPDGIVIDERIYDVADLSKNRVRSFLTLGLNLIESDGVGVYLSSGSEVNRYKLEVNADKSVTISTVAGSASVILSGSGTFDSQTKQFALSYIYSKGTKKFKVDEVLILRQDPEKDLRFETWN